MRTVQCWLLQVTAVGILVTLLVSLMTHKTHKFNGHHTGHATMDRRIDANVTQMLLTHNLNFNFTLNLSFLPNLKQGKFLKYLLISSEKNQKLVSGSQRESYGGLT